MKQALLFIAAIAWVSLAKCDGGHRSSEHQQEGNSKRLLLEDNYAAIVSQLSSLTQQMETMQAKLDALSHGPVAFKAHLSGSLSPGLNEKIVFGDVQLNLGNAYYVHGGNFIAPYNGTYLFSVSVCSDGNHYVVLDLMRNDAMIGRVLAGDTIYNDCSSETTIALLQRGDEIYVQHHGQVGDNIHASSAILNSFTGALLQVL